MAGAAVVVVVVAVLVAGAGIARVAQRGDELRSFGLLPLPRVAIAREAAEVEAAGAGKAEVEEGDAAKTSGQQERQAPGVQLASVVVVAVVVLPCRARMGWLQWEASGPRSGAWHLPVLAAGAEFEAAAGGPGRAMLHEAVQKVAGPWGGAARAGPLPQKAEGALHGPLQ